MNWFKHRAIVVPFDFSDESTQAVKVAEELADDEQEIHVIHVVPDLNAMTYPGYLGSAYDDDLRKSEAKEKMVESLCDFASDAISLEARVGDPGHEIVEFAKRIDAGLIVIPSHGRSGVSRVLMGSVAERVTRHVHCPVLILRS
jgi:nucleotide-binding universal stress UspA family protein